MGVKITQIGTLNKEELRVEITVDEVVYDVVKEKEINRNCRGCFLKGIGYSEHLIKAYLTGDIH